MTTGVGNSNWQFLGPMGQGQPGSTTYGGGGFTGAGYRSVLDMKRSAAGTGRTPYAEYPDGYLGNVNSRRDDKLLISIQGRLTQRSYQRGVHKGERIDPQDYYWNDAVDPQAGLRAQAEGKKWTAIGATPEQQINTMGKNHMLTPEQMADVANGVGLKTPSQIDPIRSQRMARLMPTWK